MMSLGASAERRRHSPRVRRHGQPVTTDDQEALSPPPITFAAAAA